MTKIMDGSMLATGKFLIPAIRRPVANVRRPPQAEKSPSIASFVIGMINEAPKKQIIITVN